MPRPAKGFWVDRSALHFAGKVMPCPRTNACDAPASAKAAMSSTGVAAADTAAGATAGAAADAAAGAEVAARRVLVAVSGAAAGVAVDCWAAASTDAAEYAFDDASGCDDAVLCTEGSDGPLCGSCKV